MSMEISLKDFDKLEKVVDGRRQRRRLSPRERRRKNWEWKRKRDEARRSIAENRAIEQIDRLMIMETKKESWKQREKFLDRVVMRCLKKGMNVGLRTKEFSKVMKKKDGLWFTKTFNIQELVFGIKVGGDSLK